MANSFKTLQIISGGQTGVDRAALDFALENKINCSGWCPKGRRAEDGFIPLIYPLKETLSSGYAERTIKNVEDSDGLIVFVDNEPDKGTVLAIDFAEKLNKPIYIVHLKMNREDQETGILTLIETYNISKLNIAGPRESHSPGIYVKTKNFLNDMYLRTNAQKVNG